MLTYYECLGNLSELVSNSVQQRAQSPQHEVLRAFLVGAWQARLPKHPSEKPVTPKACGALGQTNLLRCVSAANTTQSWAHVRNRLIKLWGC